jgi:hypothetical protein
MRECGEELSAVDQTPAAQQVFATMTELAGEATTALPPDPELEEIARQEDEVMDDAGRNNPRHQSFNFRSSATSYHLKLHAPCTTSR